MSAGAGVGAEMRRASRSLETCPGSLVGRVQGTLKLRRAYCSGKAVDPLHRM